MAHARQQIRTALVAQLTGLAATGANVHSSRVYAIDVFPCLSVYVETDNIDRERATMDQYDWRELTVAVEARVKAVANGEDLLDTICSQVEVAINSDVKLGINIVDTLLVDTQMEYSGEAEQPVALATMRYTVEYQVDRSNPDILV